MVSYGSKYQCLNSCHIFVSHPLHSFMKDLHALKAVMKSFLAFRYDKKFSSIYLLMLTPSLWINTSISFEMYNV